MGSFISIEELYKVFLKAGQAVTTDTRKLNKGEIFFALKGPNFNAGEFAQKAIDTGCVLAIVEEEKFCTHPSIRCVENVLICLQQLARHHRRQFSIPILAITGSNAKTTHKEFIQAVVSKKYHSIATEGNLNNHIGVPLTLLKMEASHQFAIVEMGANHKGEIEALCQIAEPNYGLITNIGKAHLEGFGGLEGVKQGKSEMYRYLKSVNGKIFVNGDDNTLIELAIENDKITYGCNKLYDVIGKDVSQNEMVSFKYTTRYGEKDWNKIAPLKTQILGQYNFINCIAAVCVGHYFKVEDVLIKEALEKYLPQMNRSQLKHTSKNRLILDAYNANPNSMKAAIENFAKYPSSQKWLFLGDMFELGEYSHEEHQKVVNLLKDKNFSKVILVGEEFLKCEAGNFVKLKSTEECLVYAKNLNIQEADILIKGSRGMKMERLEEAF